MHHVKMIALAILMIAQPVEHGNDNPHTHETETEMAHHANRRNREEN